MATIGIEEKYDQVRQLITMGKERGYLLYDEVNDILPAEVASSEEIDDLLTTFERYGIEVYEDAASAKLARAAAAESGDAAEGDRPEVASAEEPESELDLSPGTLEKTNDPVRMYLREMGTVPLLDREGEVEIAQRIENGEWMIYEALCSNQVVLRELLRLNEMAQKDKRLAKELVTADPAEAIDAKSTDRIKKNLATFERIGKRDREIRGLREKQKIIDIADPRGADRSHERRA